MESVRLNYNKCAEQSFSLFINNINSSGGFKLRAHNPADNSILQDRYTFTKNKYRISVVYETKSQTLIVTAPDAVMGDVTAQLPKDIASRSNDEHSGKPAEQKTQNKARPNAQPRAKTEASSDVKTPRANAKKAEQAPDNSSTPAKTRQKMAQKTNSKKGAPVDNAPSANKANKNAKRPTAQQKEQNKSVAENTFTIKKISPEKFDELLKKIKANKNMRYKQASTSGIAKAYAVSSHGDKVFVKYENGNIELSGSRGDLYGEIQLYMSQLSDYKTAIKTHIKYSGEEKRAQDIERQLKKKLPDAFEFLSDQSKLDLAIGVIDINNSAVVLSDYSTLLIPCFRGLERLIFDLQHAQGIVVKMIGQAYEKEDGRYVLKSGYRKKIPSVIYAEVMAALYTEYFLQRNFYAHSDGGYDNISRIISDKKQVQSIFNHILEVINYNGKKLREIGFRIQ